MKLFRSGTPAPAALADYLPHRSLLRLLAVLAIVVAPHVAHMAWWESVAIAALIVWRGAASSRRWGLPPAPLKVGLALAAFVAIWLEYGRVTGQVAGVALLVLMLALKLTEMRSRRDVMITVFLMYFLLVTHFLFSQELWTILYLLGCCTLITAVLVDAHHPGTAMPLKASLRMSATMVAQALPLMVLFFVLFPRIPGPLWGLPNDAGAARSGLSDSMAPGDISSLVESDEPAFRVRFEGAAPPGDALYWRGPVFDVFDGRTWRARDPARGGPPPTLQGSGDPVRYEVTLEPMRTRWLFALDAPDRVRLPGGAHIDAAGTLVASGDVTERRLLRLASHLRYALGYALDGRERERQLRLPEGFDPRTVALARRWRDAGMDDAAIVQQALRMFAEQSYVYTLQPPALGRDAVDEFLFATKRGFCEHYAGAFTFLMRAAGVPARVVTGYQGGTPNEIGGYYRVGQGDAHAWSEVWLGGRGWVRVDPTAAVAPNRVERGLAGAVSAENGLPGYLSRRTSLSAYFEIRWDWINAKWNEWVLAYGPDLQMEFLRRFGMDDVGRMILALTIGVSGTLLIVGLFTMRRAGPPPVTERSQQLWRRALQRLAGMGYEQRPDEGPRDFALRVIEREPSLAVPLGVILDAYLRLRYAGERNATLETAFEGAIRNLRR